MGRSGWTATGGLPRSATEGPGGRGCLEATGCLATTGHLATTGCLATTGRLQQRCAQWAVKGSSRPSGGEAVIVVVVLGVRLAWRAGGAGRTEGRVHGSRRRRGPAIGRMCHEPPAGIEGTTAVPTSTHCGGDRHSRLLACSLVTSWHPAAVAALWTKVWTVGANPRKTKGILVYFDVAMPDKGQPLRLGNALFVCGKTHNPRKTRGSHAKDRAHG